MKPKQLALLLVCGLCLSFAALACSDDDDKASGASASSVSAGVTEVMRQILQTGVSDKAAGQELILSRVIVPPGQSLASHTHPGTQLAVIAEGTLTYTIIRGEVGVTRAAGLPTAKKETYGAGKTIELKTGDTVAEQPGMVHEARNAGSSAVVIYLSSLFPEGAPASSPAQ